MWGRKEITMIRISLVQLAFFLFCPQTSILAKSSIVQTSWSVKRLPQNSPFRAAKHLEMTSKDAKDIDSILLDPDQVLIQVEAFSIDAFLRTLLIPDSFHLSLKPGDSMRATGYGTVVRAGINQAYKVGSRVVGMLPVGNLVIVEKSPYLFAMKSLPGVPPSRYLDLLGTSGLSAYVGIFLASHRPPQKGETVVVSAAAGGVGTCAVQMAKLTGARVVGIAGGPAKTAFLRDEVGVDATIDYKDRSRSIEQQLAETCPDGVDFFLDNVGGPVLDSVLDKINIGARIVICGAISQYDTGKLYSDPKGPKEYLKLAEKSASMSGFVLGHYLKSPRNLFSAMSFILWHYWRGSLRSFVHLEKGIDSFGDSMEKLLNGGHTGRLVVDISGDL